MRVETPPNSVLIFWPGGGGGSRLDSGYADDLSARLRLSSLWHCRELCGIAEHHLKK